MGRGLIELIIHGDDDTDGLDVRGGGVAVLDGELTLVGMEDLAKG